MKNWANHGPKVKAHGNHTASFVCFCIGSTITDFGAGELGRPICQTPGIWRHPVATAALELEIPNSCSKVTPCCLAKDATKTPFILTLSNGVGAQLPSSVDPATQVPQSDLHLNPSATSPQIPGFAQVT